MDKSSLVKLLNLPEPFAVVLLSFSFILLLAPYFSGTDFGLFKIPNFTRLAKRWLKILGPIGFMLIILSFVPLFSENRTNSPSRGSTTPPNVTDQQECTSDVRVTIISPQAGYLNNDGNYVDSLRFQLLIVNNNNKTFVVLNSIRVKVLGMKTWEDVYLQLSGKTKIYRNPILFSIEPRAQLLFDVYYPAATPASIKEFTIKVDYVDSNNVTGCVSVTHS